MLREENPSVFLVGPPEGTYPRCAMVMVTPGISSGIARTIEIRARDSESLVLLKSGATLAC